MQRITPHLWFDREAREAAEFYVSLFSGSRITNVITLSDTPSGDCDLVSFELAGQPFMAISAGPLFRFNPSVSFQVKFRTNDEVDPAWEKLSSRGKILLPLGGYPFSEHYGWLEDRYGLSWQLMRADGDEVEPRLMPVLMFVGKVCGKAEEAMSYYAAVFKNAPYSEGSGETNATVLARYGQGEAPDTEGTVRYAHFSLLGQEFGTMDSARAHQFTFNEAISFLVPCDSQEEIDYFWDNLSADPKAGQCGWLKDKYGLSWQIAPAAMRELLGTNDRQQIARVTKAFLKMKKFDIAALKRAAAS